MYLPPLLPFPTLLLTLPFLTGEKEKIQATQPTNNNNKNAKPEDAI